MIAFAGGLLAFLGILAGALLVAAPLGLVATTPGLTLGLLFPVLTVIGWFVLVVADRNPLRGNATRWVSLPLLAIALCAVAGLVASALGVVEVHGASGTVPLWVVVVLGGPLGLLGTAAYARRGSAGPAS